MKVFYSSLDRGDLLQVLKYISAESPKNAGEILKRIETQILSLKEHPELGRAGRVPGTRELVISSTPFIAPYQVREDRVIILRVYHARRKWPESF